MSVLLLAASTGHTASTGAKSVSAGSLFFQLIIGLAVVLAIIAVVSKVLRKRVGGGAFRRSNQPLAVLGRQSLGKGVQIAIVRAGTETMVLGVTQHQVSRLGRFRLDEGDESTDDLPAAGSDAPPVATGPVWSRWGSSFRQMQERTVRRG